MFEKAIRLKLRFESSVGLLGVEDLWDLPLTSAKSRANLNDIAKAVNARLKAAGEEDFVAPARKGDDVLQLQLDILKHVIAEKQAEGVASAERIAKREQKARIMELIARKQDQALEGKPLEELQAMVAGL